MKEQTLIPTEKERGRITYKIRVLVANLIMWVFKNPLVKWSEEVIERDQRIKCETDRIGKGYGTIIRFEDTLYKNLDNLQEEDVIMREFWPLFKPEAQRIMGNTVD